MIVEPVKQVIVVRTDLKMPVGKVAAQVAHASMAFMTGALRFAAPVKQDEWGHSNWHTSVFGQAPDVQDKPGSNRSIFVDDEMAQWIDGAFTKVVVGCDDEEMLLAIYNSARTYGLRHKLIQDEGRTVFNGVPTYTCVGIGPNYASKVDAVTKALKLFK